jgi:hypothetical protein
MFYNAVLASVLFAKPLSNTLEKINAKRIDKIANQPFLVTEAYFLTKQKIYCKVSRKVI